MTVQDIAVCIFVWSRHIDVNSLSTCYNKYIMRGEGRGDNDTCECVGYWRYLTCQCVRAPTGFLRMQRSDAGRKRPGRQ